MEKNEQSGCKQEGNQSLYKIILKILIKKSIEFS